jgi:predicted membrane-bound mannosyltransferase
MAGLLQAEKRPGVAVSKRERAAASFMAPPALELLVLLGIFLLAVATRAINLDEYSGDLDEGIRGMQLLLMRAGYRPFQDISASQGPLLLDLLYPLYNLYGGSLAAARMAVGTYSLLAILGAYWIGRQVAGQLGAAAAAILLALSPTFLRGSRHALAEAVALGPATLAVGASLVYLRGGRRAWLLAAGVLLAISLLIKPIAIAAAVPLALAALLRGRRGARDLLVTGAVVAAIVVLAPLLVGLGGVLDQVVD